MMRVDRGRGGPAVGLLAVLFLTAGAPVRLTAQDSQFGIRGLGTPGRWESVRARSTGGAFAPFDLTSPLMEASLADAGRLVAGAMEGASYRRSELAGTAASLRETRFPLMGLSGRVFGRLAVSGGFTTYLDRSWDVTIRDTVVLRGTPQPYTDEIASDGGVADLRLAAATRLRSWLAVGAGVHLLSGSTRVSATRRFDDSTSYQKLQQSDEVSYDGFGVSGSLLLDLTRALRLAAWARSDDRLRARVGGAVTAETDLPTMIGGGVRLAPSPSARLAAAVAWRSWSRAGPGSFNTLSWSAGMEVGAGLGPFRLGVRGGQLPFGPGATAPTEFGIAAGTGRAFAEGRGIIDFGVERLQRSGGGLEERVWTFLLGLTIRP